MKRALIFTLVLALLMTMGLFAEPPSKSGDVTTIENQFCFETVEFGMPVTETNTAVFADDLFSVTAPVELQADAGSSEVDYLYTLITRKGMDVYPQEVSDLFAEIICYLPENTKEKQSGRIFYNITC